MPRYIDAEYFAERLKISPAFPNYHNGLFMRDIALDILVNMPTSDVVEVVRCEDCAHYNTYMHMCIRVEGILQKMPCDGFCSCGKKKEQT